MKKDNSTINKVQTGEEVKKDLPIKNEATDSVEKTLSY